MPHRFKEKRGVTPVRIEMQGTIDASTIEVSSTEVSVTITGADTSLQDIEIPMSLPSRANLHAGRWVRTDLVRAQRKTVLGALEAMALHPSLPCVVRLIRVAPHALDDDNVRGALKGPRDTIAAWLGLPNDRVPSVRWRYGQQKNPKGKPGYTALRVIITEGHENCPHCGAPTVGGAYV